MTCPRPPCAPTRCGDRVATADGGWACGELLTRGWFSDLKRPRLAQRVGARPTATTGARREMAGAATKEG